MPRKVDPIIEIIKERHRLGLPFDPHALGHVVKEMKIGNTMCYICDDDVVQTQEEVDEILAHCGKIWTDSMVRQAAEKACC